MTISYQDIAENLSQHLAESRKGAVPIQTAPAKPSRKTCPLTFRPRRWLGSKRPAGKRGREAMRFFLANRLEAVLAAVGGDEGAAAFQLGGLSASLPDGTYSFSDFWATPTRRRCRGC